MEIELIERADAQPRTASIKLTRADGLWCGDLQCRLDEDDNTAVLSHWFFGGNTRVSLSADNCREVAAFLLDAADTLEARQ